MKHTAVQFVDGIFILVYLHLPSVLWRCWLGGRKGIRPVKNLEWWSTGMVICLKRDADLHVAQLMPLPLTISCFSKIQIGFTFLVPAHLGSPGKRAIKRVCVCVYLHVRNILACWYMLICLWLCCVKLLKLSSCHFLQLFLTKGYICWSEYLFSIPGSISLIYMHFGTNQIVYSTSEWCVIVPSSLFSHLCRPRTESCYTIWIGLTW